MNLISKLMWKFYDWMMSLMDRYASPRPVSREEMDKEVERYKKMAEEHPDEVIKE